jgi:hypothetical protein
MRGYALGQGAGTQALIFLPWALIFGTPGALTGELLMGAGWAINLAVAEWIIRRGSAKGRQKRGADAHGTAPSSAFH